MTNYYKNCYATDTVLLSNMTIECSDKILASLGIEITTIKSCVKKSFVRPGDFTSDNLLL